MTQLVKYPLPPLFLTEIIERAKTDHTHQCDDFCRDGQIGTDCCRTSLENDKGLLDVPIVVKIEPGHGRHIHSDPEDVNGCNFYDYEVWSDAESRWVVTRRRKPFRCMTDCDDSDWIVHLQYHQQGWQAVYGVKRHGDVQQVILWAD